MPQRNKKAQPLEGPLTRESLRQWLTEHLAARVNLDPADIDPSASFESYGIDSRAAVQVSGTLEKLLKRRLSPALLYERHTIDDLSAYLAEEMKLADRV